jgi:hypothetical protein
MGLTISYLGKSIKLSDYIEQLIDIVYTNATNIRKDNITYLDERYRGIITIERGFQTVIKVSDTKSGLERFKYLKNYQIANDEKIVAEIGKAMGKLCGLQNFDGLTKIEDFFIENNRKANKLKMFIIEEYIEYISLQDFLGFLYDDYLTGKIKFKIENLYNELTKLIIAIFEIIETLNRNQFYNNNMRMGNLMLCKDAGKISLKFTDLEVSSIFSINMKDKKNQISDLQTIDNNDYHNLMILLFQILFYIKNLSFKSVFEFSDMFKFYETESKVLELGINKLISEDRNKLLYLNLFMKYYNSDPSELKELNNIYKDISMKSSTSKLFHSKYSLDLLFSLVDSNEDEFLEYFFNVIYDYEIKDQKLLINYIVTNSKLQLFIAKYVSFISTHYQFNKKIGK